MVSLGSLLRQVCRWIIGSGEGTRKVVTLRVALQIPLPEPPHSGSQGREIAAPFFPIILFDAGATAHRGGKETR